MALFRQQGRLTWQARVWSPVLGRVKSFSCKTEDRLEAEQVELQLRIAMSGRTEHARVVAAIEQITGKRSDTGLPMRDLWAAYCVSPAASKASPLQHKRKRGLVTRFVTWATAHGLTGAADVTPEHAARFLTTLDGATAKTVQNVRGNLHAVFAAVKRRAGLVDNPFSGDLVPATGGPGERGRAFTPAEISTLLENTTGQRHGIILAGLYTGLRYSDCLRLRWADLRDDGNLYVTPSKTKRHGVEVVIPIHRRLGEWLRSAPRARPWIFPECQAADRSSKYRGWFAELLRSCRIVAGPGEYVGFHCLRHTFRSMLAAAGTPQDVAMQIGGWMDSRTAAGYNHDLVSARRAIDSLK